MTAIDEKRYRTLASACPLFTIHPLLEDQTGKWQRPNSRQVPLSSFHWVLSLGMSLNSILARILSRWISRNSPLSPHTTTLDISSHPFLYRRWCRITLLGLLDQFSQNLVLSLVFFSWQFSACFLTINSHFPCVQHGVQSPSLLQNPMVPGSMQ